jgi:hypothetical protein
MSELICAKIVIHSILIGYSVQFYPTGGTIKIILWPAFQKSTTAFITIPAVTIQNTLTNQQFNFNPAWWSKLPGFNLQSHESENSQNFKRNSQKKRVLPVWWQR